ncbi:2,4-dichlorophenol 6-monooxygenase [Sphingomonas histidinilytica]|uniref:FAD-dependent oxidoreductase n=1 Tax=Rhizorhabdus histidinilytica TaxID=439228 RepID=UPI001ADC341A|nr:FAD-dependent monooxygenase [Rhizorhabdus histidinilytica]MBO9380766.1 2,4-dichlorophenol 6-monooxygenase [Rhizorhabdus histidinilytica]
MTSPLQRPAYETEVLIIGTGPAGGTLALALAKAGIRVVVVNRYGWTCRTPRAHITNPRTMEIFHDLGVIYDVNLYAMPGALMGENVMCQSLAGEEFGRLRTWGNEPGRKCNYAYGTPETNVDLPQTYLENILLGAAAHKGAEVLFHTEFLRFDQDEDGVTSLLHNRLTGEKSAIRSKYLVGADGARSAIAAQLGLPFKGEMDKSGATNIVFTADLTKYVEHRPSSLYWMFQPGDGPGGIVSAALRTVRPWNKWLGTTFYDINNPPDIDEAEARRLMHLLIGDDSIDVQIESVSLWAFNESWATRFQDGRVFCAGDAVHRHPPLKGLGSNTSVQDSYNLAWKLAYVLRGMATPSVLDSYSQERVPVAEEFVPAAFGAMKYHEKVVGALNPTLSADPAISTASFNVLKGDDTATAERRRQLQQAVADTYRTFDCPGIELNQRYRSCAVAAPEGEAPPAFTQDPEIYYQPTSFPGARLPHAWLFRDGRKISSLYVCGGGEFTLLTGNSGAGWRTIAKAVSEELGVPIRVITIGLGQDYQDLYGDYARISEVEESGALLVRPDVYIGWRTGSLGETAQADLNAALSAILGRGGPASGSGAKGDDAAQPSGKFDEMERSHFP